MQTDTRTRIQRSSHKPPIIGACYLFGPPSRVSPGIEFASCIASRLPSIQIVAVFLRFRPPLLLLCFVLQIGELPARLGLADSSESPLSWVAVGAVAGGFPCAKRSERTTHTRGIVFRTKAAGCCQVSSSSSSSIFSAGDLSSWLQQSDKLILTTDERAPVIVGGRTQLQVPLYV